MHWSKSVPALTNSKFEFWIAERMKCDIWDSVTHILQKRVIFEEVRAFLVETNNFGPKTSGRCSSYVSEALGAWNSWQKHRSVYQNTRKITVPAGLTQHARCKNVNRYGEYDALTAFLPNYEKSNCIFWTAKGVQYEISYFVTHFFEKRAVFEEIDAFFVETENFRLILTQNISETQCQRFRSARSVKSLKTADSCTKTSVKKPCLRD